MTRSFARLWRGSPDSMVVSAASVRMTTGSLRSNAAALWAAVFLFVSAVPLCGAEIPTERRYVEVTGEGEVAVFPDEALLSIGVEASGKSAKDAQQKNARQTQAFLDALKKRKIESKDIRSDSVIIQPRHEYEGGKSRLIDYVARKNFSVLIRDIANYGAIIEGAMDAGAQNVSGVQFRTSQKGKLEAEARKLAVEDARQKAAVLAESLGQKVGKPLSIVEGGFAVPVPMVSAMAAEMRTDSVPDQLAPGEITIRGTVQVRFELE